MKRYAALPDSSSYCDFIFLMASSEDSPDLPIMQTVPPLPPPVILAPNKVSICGEMAKFRGQRLGKIPRNKDKTDYIFKLRISA